MRSRVGIVAEADLALFCPAHKDYRTKHGIPHYAATNGSKANYNVYDYRDIESIKKAYGREKRFWYGRY